jgi:hypothetical protein
VKHHVITEEKRDERACWMRCSCDSRWLWFVDAESWQQYTRDRCPEEPHKRDPFSLIPSMTSTPPARAGLSSPAEAGNPSPAAIYAAGK